ncbi:MULTISPECIES: ArdC family protein [Alphaproteobacteria]|uniref:Antirestriction protein n=2 Tax=Alphaproteobacteria TaxID=28211 RepID=A0A512HKL6_9HYPH|nr:MULTISPECIES: zincin-like metallopeptidase domain-containing protein [Alphaproteobacteria]GEO85971.1 antirestriction protein [Ciceribacter naphthalenivorans]GLR23478.1 antirestriction protein [Ciceribacter naphthalenivorans]GLT06334.1 antirestriction protein [Sphingomonas psychrolutea]
MSRKESGSRVDVYARITEKIVEDLEKGVRPWVQPWRAGPMKGRITRPLRHNGEPYTGMNVLLLWSEAMAHGYAAPIWMTLRQANELGAHVRKGETSATVIYASRFTKTETAANGSEIDRDIPFLKAYGVFNVEQIDGLPDHYYYAPKPVEDPIERIEHADRFFANTGSEIRHGGSQAFFSPSSGHIQMPPFETFRDAQSYVAVLAHEHIHWTADSRRVGRDLSRYAKDRSERAREELVAEIGSSLICADLGIVPELEPRPDHASYIQSWLTVLQGDRRAVFQAAAHAQRAVAFLHQFQPQAQSEREAA